MTRGVEDGRQEPGTPHRDGGASAGDRWRIPKLLLAGLGGASLPLLFQAMVSRRLPPLSPDLGDVLLGLAALAVLFVGSIVVHELGHVVGGRLARLRLVLFGVWPLMLLRQAGAGWTLRRHPGLGFGMGFVLGVPEDNGDLRRRLMWMIAGGPAASLAAAVACLAGFLLLTPEPAARSSTALTLALLSVFGLGLSLFFVLGSLVPFFDRPDGARLATLRAGGDEAEAEVALFALLEALRPSDVEAAPAVYAELCFQAAWFAAVHDGDADEARRWLDLGMSSSSKECFERALAEAALLALDDDREGAGTRLDEAVVALARDPAFGPRPFEQDQIDDLRTRLRGGEPDGGASPAG